MKNSSAFLNDFSSYSGAIGSSLATMHRAIGTITSKVKIGT
jgi:hypothetical protein